MTNTQPQPFDIELTCGPHQQLPHYTQSSLKMSWDGTDCLELGIQTGGPSKKGPSAHPSYTATGPGLRFLCTLEDIHYLAIMFGSNSKYRFDEVVLWPHPTSQPPRSTTLGYGIIGKTGRIFSAVMDRVDLDSTEFEYVIEIPHKIATAASKALYSCSSLSYEHPPTS